MPHTLSGDGAPAARPDRSRVSDRTDRWRSQTRVQAGAAAIIAR